MLTIKHFSKCYKGGKRAVKDLNLQVEARDLYGFIGHNGLARLRLLKL